MRPRGVVPGMTHDDCLFVRLGDFFAARRAASDAEGHPAAADGAPRPGDADAAAETAAPHHAGAAASGPGTRARPAS
jgi:hypothetical protein